MDKEKILASDQSLRDEVTRLYNKKHLLRRLKETMSRCDRSKEKFSLILWDIDGFIQFNNDYGQKEGDKLLRKVAETIKRSLREYDEAFRCGPDEFCAILFPADEKMASEVTQRVSGIVTKDLFENDASFAQHKFSLASGEVFYPSEHKLPDSLLHAAGQALYKSKISRSQ